MFNKCLYINAYVQSLFQKEMKVASKMFEVPLRTKNAYRLEYFVVCFRVIWEAVGH